MAHLPTFLEVSEALSHLSALGSASESHGLLCALLSAHVKLRQEAWVDALLNEHIEQTDKEGQQAYAVLQQLFQVTQEAFQADDFSMPILLPADEVSLEERIDAVSEWCSGYITGLHLLGMDVTHNKNPLIKEALDDLVSVSRVELTPEDEKDPESEIRYVELIEFVKAAVLTVADELKVLHDADEVTLH